MLGPVLVRQRGCKPLAECSGRAEQAGGGRAIASPADEGGRRLQALGDAADVADGLEALQRLGEERRRVVCPVLPQLDGRSAHAAQPPAHP